MQYFEDKKLVKVEECEDRTKRVTVEAKNGTVESFDVPNWEFEVNSSETSPVDASDARNNRAIYVVDAIYDLFKGLDVKTADISYILQKLLSKVQGIEAQAILNSFGKADESDIRLSDWEKKL